MLGYLGLYPERFAESIVVAREVNIQFPITIFKHNELSVCRYGCDGKPQANRTYAYFEYPSYVTMLLREVRYGIQVGLNHVKLDPFVSNGTTSFGYHVGNVDVDYSPDGVAFSAPGWNEKAFTITGLVPSVLYDNNASFHQLLLPSMIIVFFLKVRCSKFASTWQ